MKFDIIVSDPPWSFNDKLTMSDVKRGADSQYNGVLTLQDIKNIPVSDWTLENALLALWVPSSMLQDGLDVMSEWGFQQKQIFTWVKTCKIKEELNYFPKLAFGMGRYFRGCSEHALIGIKGSNPPLNKSQRNVSLDENIGHSVKPETLQERLELMYPDTNKLEMFARRVRPGWVCVGNECPNTMGIDIRDWNPEKEEPK